MASITMSGNPPSIENYHLSQSLACRTVHINLHSTTFLVTAQFLPGLSDANLCKNKQKQIGQIPRSFVYLLPHGSAVEVIGTVQHWSWEVRQRSSVFNVISLFVYLCTN